MKRTAEVFPGPAGSPETSVVRFTDSCVFLANPAMNGRAIFTVSVSRTPNPNGRSAGAVKKIGPTGMPVHYASSTGMGVALPRDFRYSMTGGSKLNATITSTTISMCLASAGKACPRKYPPSTMLEIQPIPPITL